MFCAAILKELGLGEVPPTVTSMETNDNTDTQGKDDGQDNDTQGHDDSYCSIDGE